jgi:signal transduction histidine kinase
MLGTRRNAVTPKPSRVPALLTRRPGGERKEYTHRNVTMVRTVIHEMRSPLTVIRAYSSAVLAQKVRLSIRESRDIMQRIEASARLLETILEDLETMTEVGTVRMRPALVDMQTFVAEVATDLQALIPGRELQMTVQPFQVQTDPARLKQVLNNLVQNAHKYSRPSGRIVVQVERAKDEGRISVQDEGPGVPADEIEQIFEPYYRGESAGTRNGRGLGLAISKCLIEAQGGRLEATPMSEGRFQFQIRLPLAG